MKIKMRLDGEKEFKKLLNEYAKLGGKSMDKAIVQVAGIVGQDLAFRTSMWGNRKKTEKAMKLGPKVDAHAAYPRHTAVHNKIKAVDKQKAAGFMKAWRKGDFAAAERIARNVVDVKVGKDSGSFLQSVRNNRGRVIDPQKVMIGLKAPEVTAIIKKNMLTSGTGKAGWFSAIRGLPGKSRKPLKWLKKSSNLGSSRVKVGKRKTFVFLTNKVKFIKKEITTTEVQTSLNKSTKNFKKFMTHALDGAAKKKNL